MTLVHSDSGNLLSAVSVGTTSGGLTIYRFQHLAKTRHGLMNLATYGDRPKSCGATAPDGNARHVKTSDTTSAWLSHAPHASTSRLTTAPDTHERISRMARALWTPNWRCTLLPLRCSAARLPSAVRCMRGHALLTSGHGNGRHAQDQTCRSAHRWLSTQMTA